MNKDKIRGEEKDTMSKKSKWEIEQTRTMNALETRKEEKQSTNSQAYVIDYIKLHG